MDQAFKEIDLKRTGADWIKDTVWLHSFQEWLLWMILRQGLPSSACSMAALRNGIPHPLTEPAGRQRGTGCFLQERCRNHKSQYSNYVPDPAQRNLLPESPGGLGGQRPGTGAGRHVMIAHGKTAQRHFPWTKKGAPGLPCYGGTGAGDVYNAAFHSKKAGGGTLSQCLEYGNVQSGYTVERKGARSCPQGRRGTILKNRGGIMSDKRKSMSGLRPGT